MSAWMSVLCIPECVRMLLVCMNVCMYVSAHLTLSDLLPMWVWHSFHKRQLHWLQKTACTEAGPSKHATILLFEMRLFRHDGWSSKRHVRLCAAWDNVPSEQWWQFCWGSGFSKAEKECKQLLQDSFPFFCCCSFAVRCLWEHGYMYIYAYVYICIYARSLALLRQSCVLCEIEKPPVNTSLSVAWDWDAAMCDHVL